MSTAKTNLPLHRNTQTFARAALVLAYIAGYFSSTQNTQNTQKRIASLPMALIADNISFPQTAQKAQNYARAALVLAYIAGYF